MKPQMLALAAVAATVLSGCGGGSSSSAPFVGFNNNQPTGGTVFVSDNGAGVIAMPEIVATGALLLGVTTPATGSPTGIAASPGGSLIFTGNQVTVSIQSFTVSGNVATASKALALVNQPRQMVVDPTGQFLYGVDDSKNLFSLQITDTAGTLSPVGNSFSVGGDNFNSGSLKTVTVAGTTFVIEADNKGIATFKINANGSLSVADASQANSGSSTGIATFVAGGTTFVVDPQVASTEVKLFSINGVGALTPGVSGTSVDNNSSAPVVVPTVAANGGNTPQTVFIADVANNITGVPINAAGVLQTSVLAATNLAFVDDTLIVDSTQTHLFAAQSGFADLAVQSLTVAGNGTVAVGANVATGGQDLEQLVVVP